MTPGAAALVRLALWALPLVLGYLAGRSWGRFRVMGGLLLGALLAGAIIKPFLLGWLLIVLGFLGGVPLRSNK